MRRAFRLFYTGWLFNVKNLTLSGFFILSTAVLPVFYATIAYYMFRTGARPGSLLYVSLGAGMMGIWSSTLFGSGGLIQWQRWQGTLEYVIGVPPPLILVVLPMTIATASIGLYSVTTTLLWGWLFFDVPLQLAHPVWFALALPAAVLSLGLMGLVLASTFVLLRNANSLSNLLEYPVWLVTGLLVGLSLLPGWTRPISWVLAPTWGIRGIREAAIGGDPGIAIAVCLGLGAVYLVIGHFTLRYFERLARERADAGAGMNSIRVFFIGGYLAYRALFNWIHWSMYIPTMLGGPMFQILFFAYIGRYAKLRSDEFFVVGNAVQISAMGGIFGMAMTIGGERWTQTLSAILATPANRFALFLGRALPNLLNGVFVSAVGFVVGWWLLDFSLKPSEIPKIALVVFVTAFACTAFGMVIGAFGLRGRDIFFFANLMIFVFLLFCGVNVPFDSLPGWMQAVGRVLPLTHGIDAARQIADGASLGDVSGLIWTEGGIGLCYAALAYGLFRFFEIDGRRRASLETM